MGEALSSARAAIGEREPDLTLLFASPEHPLQDVLAAANGKVPGTVVGCSTAGEIGDTDMQTGGIAAFMVSWGDAQHRAEPLVQLDPEGERPATALTASHASLFASARIAGQNAGISLVFGDGLHPGLERLVTKMRQRLPLHHAVVGGGAGDGGALERTFVGLDGTVASTAATAVHVASSTPWGVGVGHGAEPIGERMTVTRATGNVVHELDGRPTVQVYRDFADRRAIPLDDADDMKRLLIEYELGIHFFEDLARIRAGIAALPDGSVACAGEVPEGATVSFVHGEPEQYIAAAEEAARSAEEGLDGAEAAGVLLISCITRGMVIGDRYAEEVAAVRRVFGDIPLGGFLSYGEIARVRGKLDAVHNNSLVVVAIPR
ncbi:MAG: FIST C-terminal domain-containing protein [Deltaproteobacteria bacterium]|nr:FIST C-terminal domain-containing protein [Deltaproteobacteria bacterium]